MLKLKQLAATLASMTTVLLPVLAVGEVKILDIDPKTVAPNEKQTWAKVLNEPGNDALTLTVFRMDRAQSVRVDAIRQSNVSSKERIDIPIAVKKTWFQPPLKDGEYSFRVQVLDAKSKVRDQRDFTVQTQKALAAVLYPDDPVSWARTSDHPETSVLIRGTVKSVDSTEAIVKLNVRSREIDVTFDPTKNPVPRGIEGKTIEGYISRAGRGKDLTISDLKTRQ